MTSEVNFKVKLRFSYFPIRCITETLTESNCDKTLGPARLAGSAGQFEREARKGKNKA